MLVEFTKVQTSFLILPNFDRSWYIKDSLNIYMFKKGQLRSEVLYFPCMDPLQVLSSLCFSLLLLDCRSWHGAELILVESRPTEFVITDSSRVTSLVGSYIVYCSLLLLVIGRRAKPILLFV